MRLTEPSGLRPHPFTNPLSAQTIQMKFSPKNQEPPFFKNFTQPRLSLGPPTSGTLAGSKSAVPATSPAHPSLSTIFVRKPPKPGSSKEISMHAKKTHIFPIISQSMPVTPCSMSPNLTFGMNSSCPEPIKDLLQDFNLCSIDSSDTNIQAGGHWQTNLNHTEW